jgi:hypothetical protein
VRKFFKEQTMIPFLNKLKKKSQEQIKEVSKSKNSTSKDYERIAARKGEIGEYKIDIQLSQFPKEYRYISDILIKNKKSISGYSQVDHLIYYSIRNFCN